MKYITQIIAGVVVVFCIAVIGLGHPNNTVLMWMEGLATTAFGYLVGKNQSQIVAGFKKMRKR